MRTNKIFLLCSVCFFLAVPAVGQQFGGNPSSVRWKQIRIPESTIIFPEGLDTPATRIANIISFISKPTQVTIGKKVRQIPIVLQGETAVSNGHVGLAPFRSEFYLTPPQNPFSLGSMPWPDLLAMHEYRHVQQYSNFDVGFSHAMRTLFGDGGQALAISASVPDWFFEGDAIYQESNLGKQGRGLLPSFFNGYTAIWNSGRQYTWMQLRNGSYKRFTPNHYETGYLLVAYGREKYGSQFWKNVTRDAASFKDPIYPFQKAVKKHSGLSYREFRMEAFRFFKKELAPEAASQGVKKRNPWFNEQAPSLATDGHVTFIKNSPDKPASFVRRTADGKEIRIRNTDVMMDPWFTESDQYLAYTSYRPDVRWSARSYNEIKLLNKKTGRQLTMARKSRAFSPVLNPDEKIVAAVVQEKSTRQYIRLYDVRSNTVLKTLPNAYGYVYSHLLFPSDQTIFFAVRNKEGKMSVIQIDVESGKETQILPFSLNVIGYPALYKDTLYFTSSISKKDALGAYTFSDGKLWEINIPGDNGVGYYAPSVNEESIAWHTFTADGYRVRTAPKETLIFKELPVSRLESLTASYGITSLSKTNANLLSLVPDESFPVTDYSQATGLFNFHSLIPEVDDPLFSLSLKGENILSTFESDVSYAYNRAEGYHRLGFTGTYAGLFPHLSAGVHYILNRRGMASGKAFYYDQLEPFVGVHIPLNLSKGRSLTYVGVGGRYVFSDHFVKGSYKDSVGNIFFGYLNNYLTLSHQLPKATAQIFPSFAQQISASYKRAITNLTGDQVQVSGNFYFPGLIKNAAFVARGGWLQKGPKNELNFSSGFPFSRGYQAYNFYQMYMWGATYHLPLSYPDVGFGNILYLLRVRAGLFYDDTRVKDFFSNGQEFTLPFRSAGTEITFDTKWWNQVQVSFGVRYSRMFDSGVFGKSSPNRWELILPVNIFNQ